jgi:hypothetical protein
MAWASQQPTWAIGFADEVWWSRFALPHLHAWQSKHYPVRLQQQSWQKDDPDRHPPWAAQAFSGKKGWLLILSVKICPCALSVEDPEAPSPHSF